MSFHPCILHPSGCWPCIHQWQGSAPCDNNQRELSTIPTGWLFVLTSLVGCVSQDAAFTVTVYIHKCRRKATTSVDPYAYFGRYRAHYKPIRQIMFGIRVDSDFPRLLSLGEDRMLVSAVKWAGDCWLNYCLRQSRRIILYLDLFFFNFYLCTK